VEGAIFSFSCRRPTASPAPPARIREEDFVPLAQLYGRDARVFSDDWREITPPLCFSFLSPPH